MKNLFFDLETTGVKHWRNGIHQIGGMIEVDNEIVETFNFKVKPYHLADIEDEALSVGGITKNDLLNYSPFEKTYQELVLMLSKYVDKFNKKDKFNLIGYNNASFDNQFLRAFFVQNNDNYFGSWFWSNSIDVMVLASEYLKNVRHDMLNFKLMTVAKQLGINIDETKLHDALYDIQLTREIYKIIINKTT